MEQVKPLTELLTKEKLFKLYSECVEDFERVSEEMDHWKQKCLLLEKQQ